MPKPPTKMRVLSELHGALATAAAYADDAPLDDGSFLTGAAVACAWLLGDVPESPVEWLGKYSLAH